MEYPDIEEAVRDFLLDNNDFIIGHGNDTLPVYMNEFPPDNVPVCLMVREAAGLGTDRDLPVTRPSVQIWARALEPKDAKVVLARIHDKLHSFGPGQLNDDVYCFYAELGTGMQRLDDPENQELAQYFMIFTFIIRNTSC